MPNPNFRYDPETHYTAIQFAWLQDKLGFRPDVVNIEACRQIGIIAIMMIKSKTLPYTHSLAVHQMPTVRGQKYLNEQFGKKGYKLTFSTKPGDMRQIVTMTISRI